MIIIKHTVIVYSFSPVAVVCERWRCWSMSTVISRTNCTNCFR